MEQFRRLRKYYILLAAQYIVMNMVHPVTPTLLIVREMPPAMNGVLYATMSAMLALSSPLVAWAGGRLPRRRIVQAGFLIYAIGQAGFGYIPSPVIILVFRAVSGLAFAAISGQMLSYLLDITDEDNRQRHLAYNAAISGVTVALGYLLGGLVGDIDIFAAFRWQIGILLLLFAITPLFLEEVGNARPRQAQAAAGQGERISLQPGALLITYGGILALSFICSTCYETSLNYYIKGYYNFSPAYNGWIKALTGVTTLAANCTISVWCARRFRSEVGAAASFALCAASMGTVILSESLIPFVAANMFFCIWNATQVPMVQGMLSYFPAGSAVGMYNTVKGAGMVAGSLLSGFLYEIGAQVPFILCATLFVCSGALCLVFSRLPKPGEAGMPDPR